MNTPMFRSLLRVPRAPVFVLALVSAVAVSGQIQFYGIGDLPGGGVNSQIRDALLTPHGIVAVGTASRFGDQGDTPIAWSPGGGIEILASAFPGNTNPAFVAARVLSADASVVGGSTRIAEFGFARGPALWTNDGNTVTSLGFLGGNPNAFPNVGVNCLSADGSVAYGFTRSATGNMAFRYTTAEGMTAIGVATANDLAFVPSAHSCTADGSSVVGNISHPGSTGNPGPGVSAFRYTYTGTGPTLGTMVTLPPLPGGTWSYAFAMTPDGAKVIGVSDKPGVTGGELVRWSADGSVESLGAPAGNTWFSNFGGVTGDGETIVIATSVGTQLRNPSGWFNLADLVTAAGIDLTGWTLSAVLGTSFDGRLIYGTGARDTGGQEGWVLLLPPNFMKALGDEVPPVLTLPADLVVEATSAAGAVVNFTATANDAVDGSVPVAYSQDPGTQFPPGTTTVSVSATDASGNTASGSFTVTVRDTTAPVITSLFASPASLWPPNHKMHTITVTGTATDAVGPVTLRILTITSNEPDNGLGDGDTANDIVLTGPLTASLRAERSGKGTGRIYTITIEARDAAGNASTRAVTVTVPRN